MTRQQLKEAYPRTYEKYEAFANKYGLWEQVLSLFESWTTGKLGLTEEQVDHELSDACFEWDF